MTNIAIIGSGNVATHLATVFRQKGCNIVAIYSRNEASAYVLAESIGTQVLVQPDFTNSDVDVVIVAVSDGSIEQVAQRIKVSTGTIVAHTSGSIPMEALKGIANAATGIFYPLQSFSFDRTLDFSEIPVLIEASDHQTAHALTHLGQLISYNVHYVDSGKRKVLHLAAVFTNNFTNKLLHISEQILEEAGLDKKLLYPLAKETIAKAQDLGPENAQTGPARRGDFAVVKEHLEMLKANPDRQSLYKLLSDLIKEA